MNAEIKNIKSYCNVCQGQTNHSILFFKKLQSDNPDYRTETKYFVVECMGCEAVTFRQEDHDYEATYPDENDNWVHEREVYLFPKSLKNHRALEQYLLPKQIKIVYVETIEALKSNCYLLSGVGFRAVIEAICIDKDIPGRNLEIKINNLARSRFITEKEAERLHAVRFMGNDSVHEMAVPQENALYVTLEIIEHLLNNLYIIDRHSKSVLDTFITNNEDFNDLLYEKLIKFKKDDDFPLAKYLGKSVRRLNGQISNFELNLIDRINSGKFPYLKIGEIKTFGANLDSPVQHFVKI